VNSWEAEGVECVRGNMCLFATSAGSVLFIHLFVDIKKDTTLSHTVSCPFLCANNMNLVPLALLLIVVVAVGSGKELKWRGRKVRLG
jgi:hypothetical protein